MELEPDGRGSGLLAFGAGPTVGIKYDEHDLVIDPGARLFMRVTDHVRAPNGKRKRWRSDGCCRRRRRKSKLTIRKRVSLDEGENGVADDGLTWEREMPPLWITHAVDGWVATRPRGPESMAVGVQDRPNTGPHTM
jgi:hypothetical protein